MSELTEKLRAEFHDKETRHIYVEDFLNTYIATQIKVLREKAGWTQAQLAEKAGMKQERISVLEDVNYSSWTANVLKRIAKAFDMRLSIKIESFGSYLDEFENFNREALLQPTFEQDPAFQEKTTASRASMRLLESIKDTANIPAHQSRSKTPTTNAAQLKLWPLHVPSDRMNVQEATSAATVKFADNKFSEEDAA